MRDKKLAILSRLTMLLTIAMLLLLYLLSPAMATDAPANSASHASTVVLPQPDQHICQPGDIDCSPVIINLAPIVTWTAVPASNSYVLPTDTLTFGASATDKDGYVTKVVFFIDDQVRATYTTASFQTTISGLSAGAHTAVAVAYDNLVKTGTTDRIPFNVRNSVVMGNVDGVSSDGVITGWACSSYLPQSIYVDLYLGGPAGTGTGIGRYAANVASEAGVASACGVSGGSYRLQIALTSAQRVQYGGQAIYLHGISPIGAANNLLPNSGHFVVPPAVRNAQVVSQSVATTMQVGGTQTVNVQMRNTGDYTWSAGTGFKLGASGDSTTWGTGRVALANDVAPGQIASFTFNITAPSAPGTYNFQWQMLQEGVTWFGAATSNVSINVLSGAISANPGTCNIAVGSTTCSSVLTWSSNSSASQVWGSNLDGSAVTVVASGQSGSLTMDGISTAGRRFILKSGSFTLATVDTHAIPPPEVATTVSIDYDELGHVIARRDASGQVKESYQYDADGNLTSTTDALNHVQSLTYDALDRIASSTDADSKTTSYTYDDADRIVLIVDPRSNVTTYDYDGFGQLWRQVSPDSGTTSFAYDANGLLQSMTRASGVQTVYGYDGLNRLISSRAGGVVQQATYDSCTNGAGRLCSVADATGSTSYSYTPEGEIVGRGFSISGTAYGLGYAYDGLGRLSAVVYPDGAQLNYAYAYGEVSGATLTANGTTSSIAAALTYRGGDESFAGWTSSNGLSNTLSYDGDGRLTGINVPGVQSLAFGYDGADRITRITNGMDATLTQNFQYDSPSRLTSVTSTADNESFQYDANGNRTSQSVNGVTLAQGIAATSNRLVSTGTQALGYDANGNLTTVDGVAQYHYDAFNRMDAATGASYYVNPEGQRLRKIGTLGTTFFAPDRGGAMLAEYANGGWVDYVWVNGRLIGREAGGQAFAVHADQVGRPESVTNASRSIVWSANNFAFDRQVVTEGFKLNLGFPGQYYDDETKTWNNGYRDYDAATGRYLQSDPIGLAGGASTYSYVGANPLGYADPTGLDAILMVNTGTVHITLGQHAGHAAIAIGNDATGWAFYQEGGLAADGAQLTTVAKFGSLQDMEASLTEYNGRFGAPLSYRAAYDRQEGLHTMSGQDILMRTYADEHLHDAYSGMSNNCGDFVMNVLRSGGLQPSSNSILPTIPTTMSISPADDPRRFNPLGY